MTGDRANSGRVQEHWPRHIQERTPSEERTPGPYEVTEDATFQELEHVLLNRMQAQHVKFVTDKQHRPNGRPYASHSDPKDPGVIVFWEMQGNQHAMACDAYRSIRDNARAILLCIRDKLRVQNRPAATGSAEFEGYRALPPGGDATPQAPPGERSASMSPGEAQDVLGFASDVRPSREEVKKRFRARAMKLHPDQKDSWDRKDQKEWTLLNQAKEVLIG